MGMLSDVIGVYMPWMDRSTRTQHLPTDMTHQTHTSTSQNHRQKDQRELGERIMDEMELRHIKDREVDQLSGGELQR